MSYQVGPVCYPTKLEAAIAQASEIPSVSGSSSLSVQSVTDNSINIVSSSLDGTHSSTISIPFNPLECQLLDIHDGITMGWMVASVWISVYTLMFLARVIKGETGGDYGSA